MKFFKLFKKDKKNYNINFEDLYCEVVYHVNHTRGLGPLAKYHAREVLKIVKEGHGKSIERRIEILRQLDQAVLKKDKNTLEAMYDGSIAIEMNSKVLELRKEYDKMLNN